MNIKSLDGNIYWEWMGDQLMTLLPNGDKWYFASWDCKQLLTLLTHEQVQKDIEKAIEAAPLAIRQELGV